MHTHKHTQTYTHIHRHEHTHTHTHEHTHTHTHTWTHTHTHTQTHTHTHTHTHTYMNTPPYLQQLQRFPAGLVSIVTTCRIDIDLHLFQLNSVHLHFIHSTSKIISSFLSHANLGRMICKQILHQRLLSPTCPNSSLLKPLCLMSLGQRSNWALRFGHNMNLMKTMPPSFSLTVLALTFKHKTVFVFLLYQPQKDNKQPQLLGSENPILLGN